MGMYDEVIIRCPDCNEIVKLQSKAGECQFQTYSLDDCPIEIANERRRAIQHLIDREIYCTNCSARLTIKGKIISILHVVSMNSGKDL